MQSKILQYTILEARITPAVRLLSSENCDPAVIILITYGYNSSSPYFPILHICHSSWYCLQANIVLGVYDRSNGTCINQPRDCVLNCFSLLRLPAGLFSEPLIGTALSRTIQSGGGRSLTYVAHDRSCIEQNLVHFHPLHLSAPPSESYNHDPATVFGTP